VYSLWRESSAGTAWYSNRPEAGSPDRRSCFSPVDSIRLVSSPVFDKTTIKAVRWSIQIPASAFGLPPWLIAFDLFIANIVVAGQPDSYGVKPCFEPWSESASRYAAFFSSTTSASMIGASFIRLVRRGPSNRNAGPGFHHGLFAWPRRIVPRSA